MSLAAELADRLEALHPRTAETPLFNPVFQLSLELSRQIESGELTLKSVAGLVAELECDGLLARADRLHRLVAPVGSPDNFVRIAALAETDDFETFAAKWRNPLVHVVFTAHPTFLLTRAQSAAVAGRGLFGRYRRRDRLRRPARARHDHAR